MNKIRILGIAPYEGMKNMMENIAESRGDIELTTYTRDLESAVELLESMDYADYDIIISRGGTAQLLREVSLLPVIEVPVSHYDILSAIQLAQNYNETFAIVGFPSISGFARTLCDILHYNIDIFTIQSREQGMMQIDNLKASGCSMVLSDMIATTYAKSIGLNAVLITSGSESINMAFDQAVYLCRHYSMVRRDNFYYNTAVTISKQILIVFGKEGDLLFSTCPAKGNAAYIAATRNLLQSVLKEGRRRVIRNIGGQFVLISATRYTKGENVYLFFGISQSPHSVAVQTPGIQIKNRPDNAEPMFNLFYSQSAHQELKKKAEAYSTSDLPLLITGEKGTGKDKMADLIYQNSPLSNAPYYMLDCGLIPAKSWNFLLQDPDSPFYSTGNTFYFSGIETLEESIRTQLFYVINHTAILKHNRIIFSCCTSTDPSITEPVCQYLKNNIGCLLLNLPPLRQRLQDIPALTTLFLNEINSTKGKEIIGVEPEGLALLQGYRWEANLDQFKHVLNELAVVTATPYIKTEAVSFILAEEKRKYIPDATAGAAIDLNQTLDLIVSDVISLVLAEENMNQTRTAKRLGISRSTLWRYLRTDIRNK